MGPSNPSKGEGQGFLSWGESWARTPDRFRVSDGRGLQVGGAKAKGGEKDGLETN